MVNSVCLKCNREIDRSKGCETYARSCNSCYKKHYNTFNKYKRKNNYVKVKNDPRPCSFCEIEFVPKSRLAKCCGKKCTEALYRSKNKEKIRRDQYHRYHNDVQRRLATNIRSRINRALKGAYKPASIIDSLGCSQAELVKHLESKFDPKMSWDNYGKWHIDHIQPLAKFNLENKSEFLEACHFSNLQPLWAGDNLSKGAS